MPRVIFDKPFNWHPHRAQTIHYKAGCEYPVTQACADKALAAGASRRVERGPAPRSLPPRLDEPGRHAAARSD